MFKKIVFLSFIASFPFAIHGQGVQNIDSSKYKALLFERFIEGYVLLKSGAVEQVPLNYNTNDQNIYFISDGKYMVLSDLESVDTIFLQNKKFIPFKGTIYEVIADPVSSAAVYVSYTNKQRPLVATADHNGSSRQTSNQVSNTVSDVYANGLSKPKAVEIQKHYWFEKNKKMYKADNEKQVTKIFPARSAAIEKFIQENNINFIIDGDMLKLASFCNARK